MRPEEYVKTIAYNGHMVNIGMDDNGQQYFLEYLDRKGKLTESGCGSYNDDYQKEVERLFGEPSFCILYHKCSKQNSVCDQYTAHGYCIKCPYNGFLSKVFDEENLEDDE